MLSVVKALGGALVRSKARRLSRRFWRDAADCRATQQAVLQRLLALNAGCRFHRDHGITPRMTAAQWGRVPLSDYAAISGYIDALKAGDWSALCGPHNPVRMFALSSGTTGDTKFIPITREFLKGYRRGWTIWGINTFDDHPGLNQLRILQLASDHDRFRTIAGVPCGNISGLVQSMQSRFLRFKYTLPPALLRIHDPAVKLYTTLRLALADQQVGLMMTANPSTLVHMAREMNRLCEPLLRDVRDGSLAVADELHPVVRDALAPHYQRAHPRRARDLHRAIERCGRLRPRDVWPSLGVLGVWTAGSAAAYLPAVREAYGDVPIRDHGLSASEGRMTIPFADGDAAGVLDVAAHFFEFIPESQVDQPHPDILLAHELEVGASYYILLTTASGLCRYDIRDVVRCTGRMGTTPLLEFLHKGAHIANLTGEKLTESQVVTAVGSAAHRLALSLSHYTLAPVWNDPPAYRILIEARDLPSRRDGERLATLVDIELQQLNCEYADKRATGRLGALGPVTLPDGAWEAMIHQRQARPGGCVEQYKHPCLKPDLDFAPTLLRDSARLAARVA